MSDSSGLSVSRDDGAEERKDKWKQHLCEAKGLDQIRAVINGWRADESTPGPSRSFDLWTFLEIPIRHGDIPSIVYLLEEERVPIKWTTGLRALNDEVPEDKRPEVLETLYRHGWDINQRFTSSRSTMLSRSVHNEAAVRWLLSRGADPHAGATPYSIPISHAARDGSLDTIKLLLERGADPTKGIPLKYAIMRDDENWKAAIELFLDHGCDINDVERNGISRRGRPRWDPGTVLHSAGLWNRHHMIPFLLEKGADPLKLNCSGLTPAQYALENESEEAANILAEAERQARGRANGT